MRTALAAQPPECENRPPDAEIDAMMVTALFPCLMLPILLLIGLATTIFWIWMLVECATRISRGENQLVGWIIVIALTHFIGALIYFFCARNPQLGPPRF